MALPRQLRDISSVLVTMAQERNVVPAVVNDFKSLKEAFAMDHGMISDLQDPSVPLAKRQSALKSALSHDMTDLSVNALLTLQESNLLKHIAPFAEMVAMTAQTEAGHHEAVVWSAVKLTSDERAEIEIALEAKLRGSISLEEKVDKSILGGLIVESGDWRFDSSLKGRIRQLRSSLITN